MTSLRQFLVWSVEHWPIFAYGLAVGGMLAIVSVSSFNHLHLAWREHRRRMDQYWWLTLVLAIIFSASTLVCLGVLFTKLFGSK